MEVVGWEGGREEGGGAPGEGDICSPCIFHKGEMERWGASVERERWAGEALRRAGTRRGGCRSSGTDGAAFHGVGACARQAACPLHCWHTRVSACKRLAACITQLWVCTWGR